MEICTIGFTRKSARTFFAILRRERITRLLDIRLNNTSQLAGFTKQEDLEFFLQELAGIEYRHVLALAPTSQLLSDYRKALISWSEYEREFLELMAQRRVEEAVDKQLFEQRSVLLCTEPTARQCHRRLVAEYFAERWGNVQITHL